MRRLITLTLFLFSSHLWAESLVLGCGNSQPPYVIPQNDRGIALELMKRIMSAQGYQLSTQYDSTSILVKRFNNREIDILCVANPTVTPNAYFSTSPLMVFHNEAISLSKNNIELSSISQLSQYRVGAFNFARRLAPEPFADSVSKSPEYREYPLQEQQVADLYSGKVDVIIIDRMIFRYFLSKLRRANPGDQTLKAAFTSHPLFHPTRHYAAFHSEGIRDAFDMGMKDMHKSGEYDRVINSYEKLLSDYLFR